MAYKKMENQMKKLVVANWKSHKTVEQSLGFLQEFADNVMHLDFSKKEVVICPSFPALHACAEFIRSHNLPIKLGAQTISSFQEGAYTGEVAATQVKEDIQYVIIGHSERRRYFHETDEDVAKKVEQATEHGFIPIVCIQDEKTPVPDGAAYIAFEPVGAIGSGKPDDPKHVSTVFSTVLSHHPGKKCMYGGSVTPETIFDYVHVENLEGFLIGGASLEPSLFCELLSVW